MLRLVTILSEQEKAGTVLGYVTFDDAGFEVRTKTQGVNCLMVSDKEPSRGIYVQIGESSAEKHFIGRILDGPFFTAKPGAYYLIEITSMLEGENRTAVRSRPRPGSAVRLLKPDQVQNYIGAVGDFKLGRLLSQRDVEVAIESISLNRHIGIFGTTGGGKSNSLQVLAEEASNIANRAVLIFDIEGEYVSMNEPTDALIPILAQFGKKPQAVKNFQVYVPAPNTSRNVDAEEVRYTVCRCGFGDFQRSTRTDSIRESVHV